MKRIVFALAIFALVLSATRPASGAEVSIDFFYNNLSGDEGSWVEVDDYGYCWQPNVAMSNSNWRPYADGYWAYTDVGWTWVSYESFGWATYHYGNWARVRDHGWLWVPGREWGPAWVSWRTGGDHVGWAPLPPRRRHLGGGEVVYEGRPIGGQVDIEFDIGPSYYNFVDIRYIGEPVLRERILAPAQNVTYINTTVNVTNITYSNSIVYNHGPDYNRMSAYSSRPIQRLALQRESNVDLSVAARSGSLTRVQGNVLMVATPQQFQKQARPTAPKVVRQKIAKPDLETGWMGVSDPKAKAELQQKMKTEDSKTIPPPKMQPQNPAALTAASPTPITASRAGVSPSVAPAATTATVAPKADSTERSDQPKTLPTPGATIVPSIAPVITPATTPFAPPVGQPGKGRRGNPSAPPLTSPADVLTTPPPMKTNSPTSSTSTGVPAPSTIPAANGRVGVENTIAGNRKPERVNVPADVPAAVKEQSVRANRQIVPPQQQAPAPPRRKLPPELPVMASQVESSIPSAADPAGRGAPKGNKKPKRDKPPASPAPDR